MLKFGLWLGVLAASLMPGFAQVTVQVIQDQDQFLPGEALLAAVRITNRSGQPLLLGNEADWLSFSIESSDNAGTGAPRIGDVPVKGEFTLESSQVATKRADLAPYFLLTRPGRYAIVATVHIKEWDRDISSAPRTFYIIDGSKLWEQFFGVPASSGDTNAAPEVRKYILQEANYLKGSLRLYLRLTDASGSKSLRVCSVGPMVSVSRPEPMLDRISNLHLLYQNGAHTFSYTIFNTDGDLLVRQTFDYVTSRPRLRMGDDGTISVFGGVRRETPRDVPAPTNDVPASLDSPGELRFAEPPPTPK